MWGGGHAVSVIRRSIHAAASPAAAETPHRDAYYLVIGTDDTRSEIANNTRTRLGSDIAKNRLTMVRMAMLLAGNHYVIKERLVLVRRERQGRGGSAVGVFVYLPMCQIAVSARSLRGVHKM